MIGLRVVTIWLMFGGLNTSAALACDDQSGNVRWKDDFGVFDPSWGQSDTTFFVQNGLIVLKVAHNTYQMRINTAGVYSDVDVCAVVDAINNTSANATAAGIAFWLSNKDNFYVFVIDNNGNAALESRQNGRWTVPIDWANSSDLLKGAGAKNTLRVVTTSNLISLFINGKLFRKSRGILGSHSSHVGIFGVASKQGSALYSFSNFVVAAPTAP
jgi:hypothetical protein